MYGICAACLTGIVALCVVFYYMSKSMKQDKLPLPVQCEIRCFPEDLSIK